MEETLLDILEALRHRETLNAKRLNAIIIKHASPAGTTGQTAVGATKAIAQRFSGRVPTEAQAVGSPTGPAPRAVAKRDLAPYYLEVKQNDPQKWQSWNVTPELEARLLRTLRMKPRRTASGVATITISTRPWPCSGNCVFCPSDIRMPKSYLHNEPACQRAEWNHFDPYLQVAARLRALVEMGHPTDKIEIIILGGTWSDYPASYQRWFIKEVYRALNDGVNLEEFERLQARYHGLNEALTPEREEILAQAQQQITEGNLSYNTAVQQLYKRPTEDATLEQVFEQHHINESTEHRVVGLSIETRPDAITPENLTLIRMLGATKIQIGVQSLHQDVLDVCQRGIDVAQIKRAFELLRLFGFKIHTHLMANLPGSNVETDMDDFRELTCAEAFQPDEVKLYPCVLLESTELARRIENQEDSELGNWRAYTEDELIEIMADQLAVTPPFIRISRMIRDFSSGDIIAGNKKTNLRQLVDQHLAKQGQNTEVQEIRSREIAGNPPALEELHMDEVAFSTTVSKEYFLQWITEENKIAGFLRLSLPAPEAIKELGSSSPVQLGQAMIREVHVYGEAAHIDETGSAAQHLGLGRKLIERACEIAQAAGYTSINVISSVGTRNYYRKLGFIDGELYQQRTL